MQAISWKHIEIGDCYAFSRDCGGMSIHEGATEKANMVSTHDLWTSSGRNRQVTAQTRGRRDSGPPAAQGPFQRHSRQVSR